MTSLHGIAKKFKLNIQNLESIGCSFNRFDTFSRTLHDVFVCMMFLFLVFVFLRLILMIEMWTHLRPLFTAIVFSFFDTISFSKCGFLDICCIWNFF